MVPSTSTADERAFGAFGSARGHGRVLRNEMVEVHGKKRPEVIVIAFCCSPSQGSESGVGWTWAKAASHVGHVTLITNPDVSSRDLERTIAEQGLPITVCGVRTPRWMSTVLRGKALGTLKYVSWQVLASLTVRRLERWEAIDVVHHVTFASDSLPSALLASRAPIRVWGPVGGSTRTPVGLYRYLTARGVAYEVARNVLNGMLRATVGRLLMRHATLIVALNDDARRRWARGTTRIVVESNTALDRSELVGESPMTVPKEKSVCRTALFVGDLLPFKGLTLAVESLRYAPDWRLIIYGQGPDGERARALAARMGVVDRVEFRGRVPRAEVLMAFRSADCLLFPSFHDSAPWAVGEATAQGCPVICLDTAGGPAPQAGCNARVISTQPIRTLPRRIGEHMQELIGPGVPDDHLLAERIPALLEVWYEVSPSRSSIESVPDMRMDELETPDLTALGQ